MTISSNKPNLTFVLPATGTTNVGGMEVVAKDLFHCLDATKYNFNLICFEAQNGIIPRIDPSRVTIQIIEKKPGLDKSLIPRLAAYFFATKPTILHTFNVGGLLYTMPAAMLTQVPVIVHAEHGRHEVPENPVSRRIRIEMMKRVDHITAVSEDLRDILRNEEGIPEEKITVIINGVDTTSFDTPFDKTAYRRGLGFTVTEDDVLVGTVGALSQRKNQQLLIHAAAEVPGIKVLIAGKGPLFSELAALISTLGLEDRVFLIGERADIPDFVRALDLFVLPSRMEGTSLAILEAMAARMPVVATDVGGSGELVTNDENGFLIGSDDKAAFVERLKWFVDNPNKRIEMGARGRQRVDEQFSFAKTAEAYDAVFQNALRSKGLV